jgi:uncharacterized protein (DUF427 family)
MALTAGTGPFSSRSPGRFNTDVDPPTGAVLFFDPVPQRIRARIGGETILDSTRAKLLHESKHLPVYYFPESDVRSDVLVQSEKRTHCPHKGEAHYWTIRVGGREIADAVWFYPEPIEPAAFLAGHVAFYWNAVDVWLAEDRQLIGHPRDPYARIDVYPSSRHVRVSVGGEAVAESTRTLALFESNLPTRWYFPPEDVRMELLEPSDAQTVCAYKGSASYWHVRAGGDLHEDLAWTYREPEHDGAPVKGLIAFFDERVDVELDGELQERPRTQYSR